MKESFICVSVERFDPSRPWRGYWRDDYLVPYDSNVSRRVNLRRARFHVSSFPDVVKVYRCCFIHRG